MFLIWDDFAEKDLLLQCRQQAIELVKEGKLRDAGFGKQQTTDKKVRSDQLMWMTELLEEKQETALGRLVMLHGTIKNRINEASSMFRLDG